MDNATSYNEWLQAAQKLDEIEGHDRWKLQDESELYDANLIRQRLEDMRRLEADNDIQGIMFHLRSGMVRGLGGIGNPRLHTHAYVGTKKLIEEYTEQVMKSLQMLHDAPEDQLPLERKLAFFAESRHALGKTGLLLSGGASLGMFHFGVLKALHEHNLLPRVISGSSAGSIVAALVGTRTQEEMDDLFVPGTIDLTFFPPVLPRTRVSASLFRVTAPLALFAPLPRTSTHIHKCVRVRVELWVCPFSLHWGTEVP
jgi:NTE family protein